MALEFKKWLAAMTLAVITVGFVVAHSYGIQDDPSMSFTAAGASVTVPFDLTEKGGEQKITFIDITNIGVSTPDVLGPVNQVSVHMAAQSAGTCKHEADMWLCMSLDQHLVIDPQQLQSVVFDTVRRETLGVGPIVDLSGKRGFITFTAYETDRACSPGAGVLVDDALFADWAISDNSTSATCSGPALAHGLDETGSYVQLVQPDRVLDQLRINTFAPDSITPLDIGIVLQENTGQQPGELGPIDGEMSAFSLFCDGESEICVSRPDVETSCVFFDSTPEPYTGSGHFRLHNFTYRGADDLADGPIGGPTGTMAYGFRCEDYFSLGIGRIARYTLTDGEVTEELLPEDCECIAAPIVGGLCEGTNIVCQPEPTATPSPTASPVPEPSSTPTVQPTPGPTGSPSPTPEPSPTAQAVGP